MLKVALLNYKLSTICDEFLLPSSLDCSALGVRAVTNDLRGVLAEMGNLCFKGLPLIWFSD